MYENESQQKRFSNDGFEWAQKLAFDLADLSDCQHEFPQVCSLEDATAAMWGRWEAVILAGVDGPYVDFATDDGFRRMWSHKPEMLDVLRNLVNVGHEPWWSEDSQFIALTFDDTTIVLGLEEGVATACTEGAAPSVK